MTLAKALELKVDYEKIEKSIIENGNYSKLALFAIPPPMKSFMKTYVSKWDIETIKAIITSKVRFFI